MPNWCNNILHVSGPDCMRFDEAFHGRPPLWGEELDNPETIDQVIKDWLEYPPKYSFHALYPVPIEVQAVGFSLISGEYPPAHVVYRRLTRLAELFQKDYSDDIIVPLLLNIRDIPDGYHWCVNNWGCKWDLSLEDVMLSDCEATYWFDTAWSPPEEWLIKVAEDWPGLSFSLHFHEPGLAFAGTIDILDGTVVEQYLWDANRNSEEYIQFVREYFGYDPLEFEEE